MSAVKSAWLIKEQALTRSLTNELKEKQGPRACSMCRKEFKPISFYSRLCAKCKNKLRRQA